MPGVRDGRLARPAMFIALGFLGLVKYGEPLRLVRTNGTSEPGDEKGAREAYAQGRQVMPDELTGDAVTIELRRVLTVDHSAGEPDIVGLMTGTWYPNGPDAAVATGCLAVVRKSG
ncbi:hypothetical protein ACQP25_05940 [Microtetraspora malaysiensis]|uniref:hypothetical protein n=1 Tax=Microtetraspora malaysiensis TaxID=161358 RepID=UPI003D8F6B76